MRPSHSNPHFQTHFRHNPSAHVIDELITPRRSASPPRWGRSCRSSWSSVYVLDEQGKSLLEADLVKCPAATLPQRREYLQRVARASVSESAVSRMLKPELLAPSCFTCKTDYLLSEPPRSRTWNLEIKSLCLGVSGLSEVPAVSAVSRVGKPDTRSLAISGIAGLVSKLVSEYPVMLAVYYSAKRCRSR